MSLIWLKDVPAEIRLIIYKTFFESVTIFVQSHPHQPPRRKSKADAERINQDENQTTSKRPSHQAINLLLTCKAVSKEAEPVYFAAAEFVVFSHRLDLPFETSRWGAIEAATVMRIQNWSAPILMEDPFAYDVLSFRSAQFESIFEGKKSQPDSEQLLPRKLKTFFVSNTLGFENDESNGQY